MQTFGRYRGLELLASITRAAHKYKKDSASRRLKFVRSLLLLPSKGSALAELRT